MFQMTRMTIVLCFAAAAGCGSGAPSVEAERARADGSTLPGVYAGTFPCGNCPGIDVTLWLTADGLFFLRQDFAASPRGTAERVYALGHWRWIPEDAAVSLAGRGPERRFVYTAGQRLEMSTFSQEPHVLDRLRSGGPFADPIRLEGTYAPGRDDGSFTECITGLALSVVDDAGRRALRSRHRNLSQPDVPALTVVDARFVWADERAFEHAARHVIVVEELISMRPRSTCAGSLDTPSGNP